MSGLPMLNRRLFVVGALSVGGLSACSSDPPPPEVFYRLSDAAPVPALAGGPIQGVVDVPQVRTMGVVGGRAILYREGPSQVSSYNYHAWQEPTGIMLQRAIMAALRNAQAFETVATPEMRLDRNYELMGDLTKLEHVLTGTDATVSIEMDIALRRVRGNVQLLAKTYKADETAATRDVASAIPAFTRAVDKICAELLADLARLPKQASA